MQILGCVFLLSVLIFCPLEWSGAMGCNDSCLESSKSRGKIEDRSIYRLKKMGYKVEKGEMAFNKDKAVENNPSATYGSFKFGLFESGFTLDESDAVVWLGCTPPEAIYFSIKTYVYERVYPIPHHPLVSLGDTINHLTINFDRNNDFHLIHNDTSDNLSYDRMLANQDDSGDGSQFDKLFLYISSADKYTAKRISDAFIKAGVDKSIINIDVIPSDFKLRFGRSIIKTASDYFTTYMRVSSYADPAAGLQYESQKFPVYLIKASRRTNWWWHRFKTPTTRRKGTGKTEIEMLPSLALLTDRVRTYFTEVYGQCTLIRKLQAVNYNRKKCLTDASYSPFYPSNGEFKGIHGCLGEDSDAAYAVSKIDHFTKMLPRRIFVIIGVNHNSTSKAVYSNVALNTVTSSSKPKLRGVVAADSFEFNNTAAQFTENLPFSEHFYLFVFARNCDNFDHCKVIDESLVPTGAYVNFMSRAYVEQQTKTGPSTRELLFENLLVFDN